jgi:VIT1/CCC1 family predicted Fe2+/Mn2+ transporter
LALLGCLAAQVGGAKIILGAMRVTFWGTLAMGTTTLIGTLFGVAV